MLRNLLRQNNPDMLPGFGRWQTQDVELNPLLPWTCFERWWQCSSRPATDMSSLQTCLKQIYQGVNLWCLRERKIAGRESSRSWATLQKFWEPWPLPVGLVSKVWRKHLSICSLQATLMISQHPSDHFLWNLSSCEMIKQSKRNWYQLITNGYKRWFVGSVTWWPGTTLEVWGATNTRVGRYRRHESMTLWPGTTLEVWDATNTTVGR